MFLSEKNGRSYSTTKPDVLIYTLQDLETLLIADCNTYIVVMTLCLVYFHGCRILFISASSLPATAEVQSSDISLKMDPSVLSIIILDDFFLYLPTAVVYSALFSAFLAESDRKCICK